MATEQGWTAKLQLPRQQLLFQPSAQPPNRNPTADLHRVHRKVSHPRYNNGTHFHKIFRKVQVFPIHVRAYNRWQVKHRQNIYSVDALLQNILLIPNRKETGIISCQLKAKRV